MKVFDGIPVKISGGIPKGYFENINEVIPGKLNEWTLGEIPEGFPDGLYEGSP